MWFTLKRSQTFGSLLTFDCLAYTLACLLDITVEFVYIESHDRISLQELDKCQKLDIVVDRVASGDLTMLLRILLFIVIINGTFEYGGGVTVLEYLFGPKLGTVQQKSARALTTNQAVSRIFYAELCRTLIY